MRSASPLYVTKNFTMRTGKGSAFNRGTIKFLNYKGNYTLIFFLLFLCRLFVYTESVFSQQKYTWTGAVSQVYNLPGNWSPSGVPGQNDTIILNSGTINIATGNPVLLGGIYLTNGTITATDSITLSGNMYWNAGTWSGTGTFTCTTNAFLFIRGTSAKTLRQAILVNEGKIYWEESGNLSLGDGAVINNSGLIEIKNNATLSRSAGVLPHLNNLSTGIIRKLSSSGKTILDQAIIFTNEGLFEVLSGSLEVRSNSTFSGTLEIKNGSPLILSVGQITWTAASLLKTNGEVILSGTNEFGGTYDVLKKTTITGGTSNFTGTVSNLGDTLNISSGYINFLSNEISVPVIQMPSGYLGGTVAIQATQVFNWSGGNINGTGSVNIPVNTKMNITGDLTKYIIKRTINNLGTISWEGAGQININDGAVINNWGLFEINNNSMLYRGGGNPIYFNNFSNGIIRKFTDGITTFGQSLNFNQQGLIDLQKGTLVLGTTASYTGNFQSAKNTLVSIEVGIHDFNPGINLDIGGLLTIKGGITRFNFDYTFPPNTIMTGGDLGGSGIITVTDTMLWSGGRFIDTGYFKIDTSGVLIISGTSSKMIFKRKILNSGHAFMRGGPLTLTPYSVISNNGEFIIDGPFDAGTCCGGGPDPKFNNLDKGDFLMNAANGPINIVGSNFNNQGYLEINHGIFDIRPSFVAGLYTQLNGTTKLDSGEFKATREIRIKGGMVKGTGHIRGSMFNSGIISPGLDAATPGRISISGQYKQDTSGVVQIDIGGRSPITGYDQLTTGNAVLAGELNINYSKNYIPVPEDKFRVIRWLSQPNQGTFDTITNLQYGAGKMLNTKYTVNDLTLYGDLASKDLWIQVIGPAFIRPGTTNNVKILYGNESADTAVFPMLLEFDHITNYHLSFGYVHFPTWIPWADPAAVDAYPELVRDVFNNDDEPVRIPLLVTIPGRKPGDALQNFNQFGVSLTPKCENGARMTVSIGEPLNPGVESCLWGIAGELVGFLPGGACIEAGVKIVLSGMQAYSDDLNGRPVTVGGWIASNGWDAMKCVGSLIPGIPFVTKTAEILDLIMNVRGKAQVAMDCGAVLLPQEGGKSDSQSFTCVVSKDPNEKVGPEGYNQLRYIRGNNPLAYAIFFENVDTATAPAQKVVVTDMLDPNHWDFSTFSFSSISIGDTTVYPPAYAHDFYMEVDLRPENNLITGITGTLDDETGVITWEFVSLDPVTHNPTTDPLAGFLPPNISPPNGQGNVVYIVQPNLDLSSGTGIGSSASIVFDNNEPMATNLWENHLDRTPPVSSLKYIEEVQISSQFELNWTGSDDQSGISKYLLYVSENGGTFFKWLSTSDTSCVFQGDTCSQYQFYILAVDSVGNRELDMSPEIQVMVNPFLQPKLEAVGVTEVCEGDSVLLKAEAGDSLVYEWYSDNQLLQDSHDSIYYAKVSGDYSVMVGTSETCKGESKHITVVVNSLPETTITPAGNLLETISGEALYQWYLNSNPITGATGNTFLAETSGDYQVKVTGMSGCSGLSEVYRHLASAVDDNSLEHLLIFPNPAHVKLNIRSGDELADGITIRIIDMTGRIVFINNSENVKAGQTLEFDLTRFKPGEYYLHIIHNKSNKYFMFTKQ
jgi:hypothetical protein